MARSKPDTIKPIADLEQANAALAGIAVLKRRLAAIEADLNELIDRAKAQAAPLQTKTIQRVTTLYIKYAVSNLPTLYLNPHKGASRITSALSCQKLHPMYTPLRTL